VREIIVGWYAIIGRYGEKGHKEKKRSLDT